MYTSIKEEGLVLEFKGLFLYTIILFISNCPVIFLMESMVHKKKTMFSDIWKVKSKPFWTNFLLRKNINEMII